MTNDLFQEMWMSFLHSIKNYFSSMGIDLIRIEEIVEHLPQNKGMKKYISEIISHVEEVQTEYLDLRRFENVPEMLLAGFAHDLNKRMMAISMTIFRFEKSIDSVSRKNELKELFKSLSETSQNVIDTIRVFGQFRYKPEIVKEVSLSSCINESIEICRYRTNVTEINIIIKDYSNNAMVLGSRELLIEAFRIIIINGIEAIEAANPDQPTLELEIVQKNSKVIITCTDNGIGIPEELMPNIFLPYITIKPHSSGLGLSIAKFIIENKFNGSIRVESKKGRTRFTIIINEKND